jgi:hypothetical protein
MPSEPTLPIRKGISLLRDQFLKYVSVLDNEDQENWVEMTKLCIKKTCGENSEKVKDFLKAGKATGAIRMYRPRKICSTG